MQFWTQGDNLYPDIPTPPEVEGQAPGVQIAPGSFEDLFSWISFDEIWEFLVGFWDVYSILAYIFSIILLAIYVYATMRWNQYIAIQTKQNRDEEALYDEYYRGAQKNSRIEEVFAHIGSDNPNDWKLAIIEADIILDETLKDRGFGGDSLGERLRGITPNQLATIDDAWEAHKVRNQIAHQGADFVLTKRIAEDTINRYRRVFLEFGIT